jgi:hypothetical protein
MLAKMYMKSRSPLVTRYMCGLKLYVLQIVRYFSHVVTVAADTKPVFHLISRKFYEARIRVVDPDPHGCA